MPELPEVETVRRGLQQNLVGHKITGAKVLRDASIGYPSPSEFAKKIVGHTFKEVERRGKYLLIHLDKKAGLGAHLRMSGRLLTSSKSKINESHVRVRLSLDNGKELIFEDMRVFGRLWYVPPGKTFEEVIPALTELGPEPLTVLPVSHFKNAFKRKTQPIKTALLDQTIVAGIGNIYADEALHLANIHPLRTAASLTDAELAQLSEQITFVLNKAIGLGGSTLRNYTDSSGVNGNYQSNAGVYGRMGKPCGQCKTAIARIRIAGRSSHFCPDCQPEPTGIKAKSAARSKVSAKPKTAARLKPATKKKR